MSERTRYERPETINGHKFIRLKSGRRVTFWDMAGAVDTAHTALATAFSRCFKLASPYDLEFLEIRIDRVEEHTAALRKYLDEKRGNVSKRERIALLRKTEGRTPEEAAAFLAKADELEAALSPTETSGDE